jgi:hypothetical protein
MGKLLESRRMVLLGVLGAALLASAAARAAEPVVIASATAGNLKSFMEKLDRLADKLQPGAGPQVAAMAAELMEGPLWAGADWTKPSTIILFSGKGFGKLEPVPVVIVTLADPARLRNAHPEGGPIACDIRGNLAILSPEKAAVAAITPERLGHYSKLPQFAAGADAYATFHIAETLKEYKNEIQTGVFLIIESVVQIFNQLRGGQGAELQAKPEIALGLNAIGDFVEKQYRRVSVAAKLGDDAIEISGRLYPCENTELAASFAAQPAEATDLVKLLPADAVLGFGGKLDMGKLRPVVQAAIQEVAAAVNKQTPGTIKPEDQQKALDTLFPPALGGEFAFAMAGDPAHQGQQGIQVCKVADAAKFRTATKDGAEWFMTTAAGDALQKFGLKLAVNHQPGVRQHQGVAVDRFTVGFEQVPNAPPNLLAMMVAQAPARVTEVAVVDDYGIAASNNPEGDLVNTVIDRIKGAAGPGLDTNPAYKAARAAAPQGASILWYVSLNNFLAKMIEDAKKRQPGIEMMTQGIIVADPNEAPITGYARFDEGQMSFGARVPLKPILDLAARGRAAADKQKARKPGKEDDF